MIITCNKCNTSFNLDKNLVKQTGSKVRCSKCKNVFMVYPSTPPEEFGESDKLNEVKLDFESEPEPGEQQENEDTIPEQFELDVDTEGLELDMEPKAKILHEEEEPKLELESEEKIETDKESEKEGLSEKEIDEFKLDIETELKKEEEEFVDTILQKDISRFDQAIEEKEEFAEKFNSEIGAGESEPEKTEEDQMSEVVIEETGIAEKKQISKPILALLIAALLMSSAYGIYVLLDSSDFKIPFIDNLFKPEVQDAGNLKINAFDIHSKFVENSKNGKFFVITGKVINEYSDTRSFISITGKLYTKGKVLSKTETVYCGNMLSNLDLENLTQDAINKRLKNRSGDNGSNIKLETGKSLPFMITFANLPDNLEEFTIEVAGSL